MVVVDNGWWMCGEMETETWTGPSWLAGIPNGRLPPLAMLSAVIRALVGWPDPSGFLVGPSCPNPLQIHRYPPAKRPPLSDRNKHSNQNFRFLMAAAAL